MSFGKSPQYFFCLVLFIMLAGNGLLAGSSFAAEQVEFGCGAPRQSNSPDFQQWRFKNTCSRKVTLHYIYKDSFGQNTGVAWAEPCKDGQILQVRPDAQIEWTRIEVEADGGGCDTRSTGDTLNPAAAQSSKAGDEIAELKKSTEAATAALQEERKKTTALTDDLATARRDLETKTALSSKAGDETAELKKSAEAATAALQEERKKTAALTDDLATARRDFETKLASSSKADDEAAELKKSEEGVAAELQQERQKNAALTSELAAMRRYFETKPASSSKADDEAAQLKKSEEGVAAELQQERQKNAALMRSVDSAQLAIEAPTAPDRIAKGQAVQAKPIAAPVAEQPPTSARKVDPEEARLIARAVWLLRQGDIGGARMVLERAIEMGSAEASFAIAETYDPGVLSHWNVYSTRGDIAKAREFYAKAAAGGIEEAKDRLASLHE